MNWEIPTEANSPNINNPESDLIASYGAFFNCDEAITHHGGECHLIGAFSNRQIPVFTVKFISIIDSPSEGPEKLRC